ncbi:MAG: conjugal transfer protein TrbJ [Hydrocarboniphaga sp.]|uniref:P-type conjugative transfer protein TrbJ n=1 Tax=Hydrocarboniphaga sp. TaxID=2033016 RepID=UPI0026324488|nr:P-type conjugative transfer protein TrbJ [Hydrocarboniphaga sp.]MDB5971177.1 conjugal transfer protein TrbJ [Hydrocarboniphaga sp.]
MKALGAFVLLALLMTSPVRAFPVFDAANFGQNLLTAVRTLDQINNQIRQLQNEAQMLSNDARNLSSLDYNAANRLRVTLATTNRLLQEAQGLAFDVSSAQSEFARIYPETYSTTISGDRMAQDARERWAYSLKALQTSMSMQAQAAQNFVVDETTLSDLVGQSQSAVGQLQATQATNQLLALQARQSIQEQQLRITQDRATALEQARTVAAQERSREVRRRFLGDGTQYTPQAVNFYSH